MDRVLTVRRQADLAIVHLGDKPTVGLADAAKGFDLGHLHSPLRSMDLSTEVPVGPSLGSKVIKVDSTIKLADNG